LSVINEQEKNTKAYQDKQAQEEETRNYQISLLQEKLLAENDFGRALNLFHQLTKSHWPELPPEYREWISQETSKWMEKLDLENSSQFGQLSRRPANTAKNN
jgi:hypothetical protein